VMSEELDELFEICDAIAVIARGRLAPPKPARETSVEEIGLLMGRPFDVDAPGIDVPRERIDAD
jgi:general nucleoside transport system ATP-binding protein